MFAGFLDRAIVQGHANAVIHEPCGLLTNSEVTTHFAGGNSILAIDD